MWCSLEEMKKWATCRRKQKRKESRFNMMFQFFLCPETTRPNSLPQEALHLMGLEDAVAYKGDIGKGWQSKCLEPFGLKETFSFWFLVQVVQNMGCSYRIWGTGPLHGWVMSVILGLAKYLWDARPSPSWPNLPTGIRGATFHSAKTHWGRKLQPES